MSLVAIDEAYRSKVSAIGRKAMAAIYSNDFELYITALELIDSRGDIVEYFIFPLNPTSISVSKPRIQDIAKTAGGTVTTETSTYMPQDIFMEGNFGRKFKFLIGKELVDFQAFSLSQVANKFAENYNNQVFSDTIKTGYGCIKILERIIDKSSTLDSYGKPYYLHLYNLAFGQSYIVKVVNQPIFKQSQDKNMIWEYSIQFKTLAPLAEMQAEPSALSNLRLLGISEIQRNINKTNGSIIQLIS